MTHSCLRMFGQVRGPARVLSCVMACLVLAGTANAQAWWDASWLVRKELPFKNTAQTENLVDFPVLVVLKGNRIDYTKTLNAGEDLRFIDADGTTVPNAGADDRGFRKSACSPAETRSVDAVLSREGSLE